MVAFTRRLALSLLLLGSSAAAQVTVDGLDLLDPVGARPLQWSEWIDFHQRLGARLDEGRFAVEPSRAAQLAAARDAVRALLDPRGDFSRLSPREADALAAAHNRLVEVLGLGELQWMHCEQRQPLGSRRRVTECRTVGEDLAARERAREGLQRLGTLPAADG